MARFTAVVIELGATDATEVLGSLGCRPTGRLRTAGTLLVELPSRLRGCEQFAIAASQVAESSFLISAETSTDDYVVAEYHAGTCLRRIAFHRDAEDHWELEGAPRPWEVDLLFALPKDEFVAYLSDDDDYTDADLEVAARAHAGRELCAMGRRPPLLGASLWEWLRSKQVDPAAPDARCD